MNIFKSKPFPELQTPRLVLRAPHSKDISAYHEILSCPETSRYSDVPSQPSEKRSSQFVRWMKKLHVRGKGVAWVIETKQEQTLIGTVRISTIEKKIRCGTVAYELHPDYWRNGYATEALRAIVGHAHSVMNLNRLEAYVTGDNKSSETVLLNNGFVYEGQMRQKAWFQDHFWDLRVYGRLAHDDIPPL